MDSFAGIFVAYQSLTKPKDEQGKSRSIARVQLYEGTPSQRNRLSKLNWLRGITQILLVFVEHTQAVEVSLSSKLLHHDIRVSSVLMASRCVGVFDTVGMYLSIIWLR